MRHEIFDMRGYVEVPVIPHILKTNEDGSVSMVTNGPMSDGDTYAISTHKKNYKIVEVLESRPAKGDWSGDSYKGMNPTYSRVKSK